MKKNINKISILIIMIITLMSVLLSCNSNSNNNNNNSTESVKNISSENNTVINNSDTNEDNYYPITYTTYNYEKELVEVTIDKSPEKVVAVYQNSIETLLALGLEDKVVAAAGLDHKVKPELEESFLKLNYLDDWQPTKETVIMLEPDFILSWYSYFGEKRLGDVDYFHNNNIGTYIALNSGVIKPRTIENECEDILTLGKIFNVNEKAEEIVNNINTTVQEISETAKKNEKKSVLLIEFSSDKIRGYGETSLGGDMVIKLGADLLNPEGNSLGIEDLIDLNPDSIFIVYYNGGKRTDEEAENGALESVLNNEALSNISAVKNNKIFAIPLGEMYASGIRTIDGIGRFASGIYE